MTPSRRDPGQETRRRVGVVTDTAAGLRPRLLHDWQENEDFRCLPLPLMVDGQIYDGLDEQELEQRLVVGSAEGKAMTTSRPSPGAFAAAYRDLAQRGCTEILSVHLSGELSGTVEAARAAGARAELPVSVLDSRSVAMSQGFAVAAALAAARRGAGLARTESAAQNALDEARLLFFLPTLEALGRSGRIPRGLALVGQMFQIKPIGTVSDGRLQYLERPRQAGPALRRLAQLVREDLLRCLQAPAPAETVREGHSAAGPARAVLAVHEFYGREAAQDVVVAACEGIENRVRVVRSALPPVLAAHAGLGALAFVAVPEWAAGGISDLPSGSRTE